MNGHDLIVANARQEQYRAEAAALRLTASHSTSGSHRILAAIARIVRASFEGPTLAPGSVIPATH